MGINHFVKIGNTIRKLRKIKGLSQKEMADLCGIAYSTYSNYENNNREPNQEVLQRIADNLDITIPDLINVNTLISIDEKRQKEAINKPLTEYQNEFIYTEFGEYGAKILSDFRKLNKIGQKEASKRVNELTEIKKYTEKNQSPNLYENQTP